MANYKHGGKAKKMAAGGLGLGIGSQLPVAQTPSSSRAPVVDTSERSKFGTGTMPTASVTYRDMPKGPVEPTPDLGRDMTKGPIAPQRRAPVMPRRGSVQMMAKGGSVGSASKRADGCAQRGKTKGKMY
jgi:hypothetical protein